MAPRMIKHVNHLQRDLPEEMPIRSIRRDPLRTGVFAVGAITEYRHWFKQVPVPSRLRRRATQFPKCPNCNLPMKKVFYAISNTITENVALLNCFGLVFLRIW